MGACVMQTTAKKDDYDCTQNQNSLLRPLDIDDLPSNLIASTKKTKSRETSVTQSTVSEKQVVCSLEDRLMEEGKMQLEEWKKQHTDSSSVILKRPNKKKKGASSKKEQLQAISSIVSELRENESIEGNIIRENNSQKMTIGNKIANIVFQLPSSRGGPLVVPYLLYENYCPADQ